jgi:exonuclease SbcC
MRNFLCYRESPPLDFTGIRLACLTGENGNGKSAVLDAITWALWGEARAKTDAELISLGQAEMEVEFEFYVGEARYRVIRKLRRTGARGTTQGTLVLHVWDGETWRDNSGSVMRETQQRIVDTLKLTHKTFVNSAFLLQGRADEFTLRSPAERKDVLAEILDLSRFDVFETRAKERRNDRRQAAEHLERQIGDAATELKKLPGEREQRDALVAELSELKGAIDEATAARQALVVRMAELRGAEQDRATAVASRDRAAGEAATARARAAEHEQTIARYGAIIARAEEINAGYRRLQQAREQALSARVESNALKSQLFDIERDRATAASELSKLEAAIGRRQAEIARLEQLVAEGAAIRAGYERLQAARAAQAEQDERLEATQRLHRRLEPLEKRIAAADAEMTSQLKLNEAEASRLEDLAARVDDLRRSEGEARAARDAVERLVRSLTTLRDEEAEHRAEIERLKTHNAMLRASMDEIKRKHDEMQSAAQHGAVECPLCRGSMSPEAFQRVAEGYNTEGREQARIFRANAERIREREAGAQAALEKARALDADILARRKSTEKALAGVSQSLAQAEEAAAKLEPVRAAVAGLRDRIERGEVAQPERQQAARLRREMAEIAYDEQAHAAARREAADLSVFEQRSRDLDLAQTRLVAAQDALNSDGTALRGCRERLGDAEQRRTDVEMRLESLSLATIDAAVAALASYEERWQALTAAEASLPSVRDAMDSARSAVEGWERECADAERRIAEAERQIQDLSGVPGRLEIAEERVNSLHQRNTELSGALGATEQEIERLERMEAETVSRRRQLTEARREHAMYEQLTKAFGRQGVQALIIDAALPEIEATANDLLGRMTNNRMHIALKTQRENQRGQVRETLDIEIGDEWGTRAYEMYSGGEAFRINLALRIALSKLLARRAGAPLPTLVIDEGFGTQDAAARERLIEALNVISQDFHMLLVVTHIEELKDLFDTRIEVTKTGDGSVARVVAA